jgi:hypothetical protein
MRVARQCDADVFARAPEYRDRELPGQIACRDQPRERVVVARMRCGGQQHDRA